MAHAAPPPTTTTKQLWTAVPGFRPLNGASSVPVPPTQLLGGEQEGHLRPSQWPSLWCAMTVGPLGSGEPQEEGRARVLPRSQARGCRALLRARASRSRGHPFSGVGLDTRRPPAAGAAAGAPDKPVLVLTPVCWFLSGSSCTDFTLISTLQLPASREEVRDDKTTIKCETSPPSSPRSLRLDRLHKGALHTVSHEDIRDTRK